MIDWDAFKSQLNANPRKMLGFVLALSVCFLVIWGIVVFQAGGTSRPIAETGQSDARLDGLRRSLASDTLSGSHYDTLSVATTDTALIAGIDERRQLEKSRNSRTRPTGQEADQDRSMVMIILLGFLTVSGGLWWWTRKNDKSTDRPGDVGISKIATRELVAGQQLMVLEVNGEVWIMAVGPQGANLLHRYEKEEWKVPDPVRENENGSWESQPTGEVDGKGWNEAWLSGLVNQQNGS